MKKILLLTLFVSGSIFSSITIAQSEEITQGYIKMEVVDASSSNEQAAAALEMMIGSVTEFFFSIGKSLVKANMFGGMFNMTTLVDNSSEDQTLLIDAMGNKMMIESSKLDREKMNSNQAEAMKELVVEYDESDTKTIAGYNCVKARIKHPSMDSGLSFEAYIARDIKASNKLIQGMNYLDIEGFPLEYIMDAGEMKLVVSTVEFKTEVDEKVFNLKTGGYKKMTWEEFMESMGQFGGGFGF